MSFLVYSIKKEVVINRFSSRFGHKYNRNVQPRINHWIRVLEVKVVDEHGKMLGTFPTSEALQIAKNKSLDLVEVSPKMRPPICRIMDFGRYKYEEKKKQSKAKKRQIQIDLKEIKLRPKTDNHDLDFKVKHIRRFLNDGHKVKLTVRFRGREITHPEAAERQIHTILDLVQDEGMLESGPKMEGRAMTALIFAKGKKKNQV